MGKRLPGKVSTTAAAKEVQRGTQDEVEIIGLIVCQNALLRNMVMDRLRQARVRKQSRDSQRQSRGGSRDDY